MEFSTLARLLTQIFRLFVIFFGNFAGTFELCHPGDPNSSNCFYVYPSARGSSSSFSGEPLNCFTWTLLQKFMVLLRVLPHLKNLFTASPPLPGTVLRCFLAHFGVCCSIFKNCFTLLYEISCIWFLYYLYHTQCAKENVKRRIPLLRTLCSHFASILGISINVLITLKHCPGIFHKWM